MDTNTYNITIHTNLPPFGGELQEQIKKDCENIMKTLEEYRLFLGVQYRKHNTQTRYYDAAKKLLNHITNLDKKEIQQYIIHLNNTHQPNTVTSEIVGLNRFLEYIQRQDLRISTPDWKPIQRDTIKKDQITSIMEHAKKHYTHMDYTILLMIRDLDCRNHEIIKLQWNWIQGDRIQFKDCKTGDTTGRLTRELKTALDHWRDTTPYPDSPHVFVIPYGPFKGRPMSDKAWYIRSLVNRISMEVIGRRLNPQDLRASVITAEYTAYVNPKIIQLKARHRSEKTTMRYNHVDEDLVAEYIENGTIFAKHKEPVLKAKQSISETPEDKRSYIKHFPSAPSMIITGEEPQADNSEISFSFSLSFFMDQGKYDVEGSFNELFFGNEAGLPSHYEPNGFLGWSNTKNTIGVQP